MGSFQFWREGVNKMYFVYTCVKISVTEYGSYENQQNTSYEPYLLVIP